MRCRPVTSDKVDDLMPLIGIPSFIKPADTGAPASTLYLVSIRPCSAAAGQPEGAADAQAEDKAAFTKLHTTMTRSQPSVWSHAALPDLCSTLPCMCSICKVKLAVRLLLAGCRLLYCVVRCASLCTRLNHLHFAV